MNEKIVTGEFEEIKDFGQKVTEASNFDELYEIIDKEGSILTADMTYTALTLKARIDAARKNMDELVGITSQYGLRDKVKHLLKEEAGESWEPSFIGVVSFDQLGEVLDWEGTIKGSQKTYTALELKNMIIEAREIENAWRKNPDYKVDRMKQLISAFPRTGGLRNRVIDLFLFVTDVAFRDRLRALKSSEN